ncbi:MAG: Swt1 family HEPN domain-containing protein [Thalassospira sp.]|uniref:hypothetical protein n=1 Tax=Thalassospira sp. TaxID=1912094 RepID=UPI0032EE30C9
MSTVGKPSDKPVIDGNLSRVSVPKQVGHAITATQDMRSRIKSVLEPYHSLIHTSPVQSVFQMRTAYSRLTPAPGIVRVGEIVEQFEASPLFTAAQRVGAIGSAYQQQLDRLRTPILNWAEKAGSLGGIIKLQTIGDLVRVPTSYDPDVGRALREELGDWRDPMTFSDNGEVSRADFYQDVGFDAELVDFRDEDFPVIIEQTGIVRPVSEIEQLLGPFLPEGYRAQFEESDLEVQAFTWLRALEIAIRFIVDRAMTEAFGSNWAKGRMPNGMYDQWLHKKDKARRADRPVGSLIDFADFSDYIRIIERKDNWSTVFSKFWPRVEDVRESFQRLHFIRIDTMHSRPLIKQDLISLYAEGRRVLEAMAKYRHHG